jgi:hypothetical protein
MKFKAGLGIFILLLLTTVAAHAQEIGLPCVGDDPDAACPLDTWVAVLAIIAAIFTAFHLYRRSKKSISSQNF